jgi:hypothetical protein
MYEESFKCFVIFRSYLGLNQEAERQDKDTLSHLGKKRRKIT